MGKRSERNGTRAKNQSEPFNHSSYFCREVQMELTKKS